MSTSNVCSQINEHTEEEKMKRIYENVQPKVFMVYTVQILWYPVHTPISRNMNMIVSIHNQCFRDKLLSKNKHDGLLYTHAMSFGL